MKLSIFSHAILWLLFLNFYPALSQSPIKIEEEKHPRFFNRLNIGYGFNPAEGYTFERDWKNGSVITETATIFGYGKGFNMGYAAGIWIQKIWDWS